MQSERRELSDDDLDEQIRRLNPVLSLADAGPLDDREIAILQRVRERVRTGAPRRARNTPRARTRARAGALAAGRFGAPDDVAACLWHSPPCSCS